jgi:dTDP-4-amino-4,6-dideoxygalactose transaminase
MARAIMLSGSYMLYERHGASPDPAVFADIRLETPNCSGRMDNLRAAILRPQLAELDTSVERWNERYQVIERRLSAVSAIEVPVRPEKEYYVGSSLQFLIKDINDESARLFIQTNKALGVELKWFGDHEPHGYTSNHKSWQYTDSQSLPVTDRVLSGLFDIRVPLTFSLQDCEHLAEVIAHCAESLLNPAA